MRQFKVDGSLSRSDANVICTFLIGVYLWYEVRYGVICSINHAMLMSSMFMISSFEQYTVPNRVRVSCLRPGI